MRVCCSEALEAEVMHLKMQSADSMKEMEVARKKSQAAQESLQKKGYCSVPHTDKDVCHTCCTGVCARHTCCTG